MKKIILLLLVAFQVSAQVNFSPEKKLPLNPAVRTGKLANGLTYYVEQNKKPENRAELRLAVNAGSTAENDDQRGLAHFVEHMAFNGTKNFKKNDLVNYLESIGTKFGPDLNAYTSFDETVYMLQIPTDKKDILDKGLLILKDWACNLTFDSLEIEKERGVVLEEWRLGQGAMERMNRKTWPILFKDSRYADRLPIGKPEVLKNCAQQLLKQFYADWYRPDLQAIIVVGDIDAEAIEKQIKEVFSDIPTPKNPKPLKSWTVPDSKEMRVAVASDKESPYNMVQLAFMQKEQMNKKTFADYVEDMRVNLYNGMINSRLSELTKKPNPPFMFGFSGYFSYIRNKDIYGSFGVAPNGKEMDALTTLVIENERVKRHGFTATEFERQKKQFMTQMENEYKEKDKTESKRIIGAYVQHFLKGDPYPGPDFDYAFYSEMLSSITLESINNLAKKWISGGENVAAVLMLTEKDEFTPPSEADVIKTFKEAQSTKDIAPYEDKAINEPLLAKKPTAQKAFKTTDRGYGITEWVLGNGVKVLIKPTDFKNDEIMMTAFSKGGASLYPEKDYLNADLSNSIQDEAGYGKFDAIALDKFLQDKTCRVYTGVGLYEESISGSSNKTDLETMLQLVHLIFTKPRKDSIAYLTTLDKQKAFIENRSNDPDQYFYDSVYYFLSGYHYTSKPTGIKDLNALDYKRSYQIFKERFSDPADFTFCFVGSFTPEEIKPLVETYLGGISASSKIENFTDLGIKPPKGKVKKIYKKGNEPRSRVNISWSSEFDYTRMNRFEVMALMKLLNIKLRENLREDKGGVYGVGIYPGMYKIPKPGLRITCTFACAPENVDKLAAAVMEEINDVRKKGCNAENLVKVKEGFLKERETQVKENNFWLSYITQAEKDGEKFSDLDLYNNWVNNLKGDDFKKFATKYINDKEMKQFILNPEK